MTTVELERVARDLVPPVGATMAIAVHDGTHHRAAWLIDGRRKSAPVGPSFDKPRAAIAFVRLINGDPTPRSASRSDLAGERRAPSSRDEIAVPSEAPDPHPIVPPAVADGASVLTPSPVGTPAAGTRTCEGCGEPLPEGRRGQRRTTCSGACRVTVARRRAAERVRADAQGGDGPVTPSRPSPAEILAAHVQDVIAACNPELRPVPTSSEAPDGYALSGASQDAGPPGLSGPSRVPVLTLGLT